MSGSQSNNVSSFGSSVVVSELISMALKNLGVGSVGTGPSASDLADGLFHLKAMLANWNQQKWMVPNYVDKSFISTGASRYSIGPGGTIDVPERPVGVVKCFARLTSAGFIQSQNDGDFEEAQFNNSDFTSQTDVLKDSSPIDFNLTQLNSYTDYLSLPMKGVKTFPSYYVYNRSSNVGELYLYPIPSAGMFEVHIAIQTILTSDLQIGTTINVPSEYIEPILWNLTVRLANAYGTEPTQTAVQMALNGIKMLKNIDYEVPLLNNGYGNGYGNSYASFYGGY